MSNQDEYPGTWEAVSTDSNYETKRLKVVGGWLVMIRDSTNSITNSAFIEDPQHFWTIV